MLIQKPSLDERELQKASVLLRDEGYFCEYQALGSAALKYLGDEINIALQADELEGDFTIAAVFSQYDANVYYMFDRDRFDHAEAREMTEALIDEKQRAGEFEWYMCFNPASSYITGRWVVELSKNPHERNLKYWGIVEFYGVLDRAGGLEFIRKINIFTKKLRVQINIPIKDIENIQLIILNLIVDVVTTFKNKAV